MRSRRRGQSDTADVDMTPMLDIVFILLIFFIVTAVFLQENGKDVVGPPPTDGPTQVDPDTRTILVEVNERNQVFVNGRPVGEDSVLSEVEKQMAELGPRTVVAIVGHEKSLHSVMINVQDQADRVRPAPRDVILQEPKTD